MEPTSVRVAPKSIRKQSRPEFPTDVLYRSALWALRDSPSECRRLELERERVRELFLETIIVAGVLEDLENASGDGQLIEFGKEARR